MSEPKLVTFEGKVHLISVLQGGEFSLCGVADDAAISEGKLDWEWKETTETVVTCPLCIEQIKACWRVKVSTEESYSITIPFNQENHEKLKALMIELDLPGEIQYTEVKVVDLEGKKDE